MLWYKGWLETRFKLAMSLGFMCLLLIFVHSHLTSAHWNGVTSSKLIAIVSPNPFFLLVVAIWLAGAGIATQAAAFQAAKGLHGSTLLTLSLPVSRFRLLAVRAGIGWMEMAGVLAASCCAVWLIYPPLRAIITPVEMFQYAGMLITVISVFYFISVFLATFLDDQWRVWGTMMASAALWWISSHTPLLAAVDIFRAMGKGSPLITHTMPWSAMAFSLGLSAVLFFAALKIVQTREY